MKKLFIKVIKTHVTAPTNTVNWQQEQKKPPAKATVVFSHALAKFL